jgi:hypothetical protein
MVSPVLLCIDPTVDPITVRRYKRNVHGKVWVMGEAVLEGGVNETTLFELNAFRSNLAALPIDQLPGEAA